MNGLGLILVAVFFVSACGGADKKVEGPLDGPDIACDCEVDPNCKTQSCAEEPPTEANRKPSADECKAAIDNIRAIRGTSDLDVGADIKPAVRSCRANSSMEEAQCFIDAKTTNDLDRCASLE